MTGLTAEQYAFAKQNYSNSGFVANPSRVNSYSNPTQNLADRYWQEQMRLDSRYTWTREDQRSYSRNSNYGPHNYNWDSKAFPK